MAKTLPKRKMYRYCLADSILRFAPIDLNKQQFSSIHGKNENITIQNIGQCVLFYKDFIRRI